MTTKFSLTSPKLLKILSALFITTLLLGSLQSQADTIRRPIDPRLPFPGRDIDPGRVFRPLPGCKVDPAAYSLTFQILRKTSRFTGVVRVTGTIKNIGRESFRSRPGQQMVLLYQDNHLVASRPFTDLASQGSLALSFSRNWNSSSPSEGEFPPTYKLVISYDPDIYLDGNSQNDDCNQRNNSKSKSGSLINALFR